MRYEIKDNKLYGYSEGQEQPVLYQPNYPDGSTWTNEDDIKAWADIWLANILDPDNTPQPPSGPSS